MTAVGLSMTVEERAAQVAALVREREGLQVRIATLEGVTDEKAVAAREQAERDLADVDVQLRLRGQEGAAPIRRAATRQRTTGAEER